MDNGQGTRLPCPWPSTVTSQPCGAALCQSPSDMEFTDAACTASARLKALAAGGKAALATCEDEGAITALMVACRRQRPDMVEVLMGSSAIDKQSGGGTLRRSTSPPRRATSASCACCSMPRRASIRWPTTGKRACSFMASTNGHEECVKLLLDAKASDCGPGGQRRGDEPVRGEYEWPYGHEGCVELLLDAKASDCRPGGQRRGDEPDPGEPEWPRAECVKMLFEAGASADQATNDGDTSHLNTSEAKA